MGHTHCEPGHFSLNKSLTVSVKDIPVFIRPSKPWLATCHCCPVPFARPWVSGSRICPELLDQFDHSMINLIDHSVFQQLEVMPVALHYSVDGLVRIIKLICKIGLLSMHMWRTLCL